MIKSVEQEKNHSVYTLNVEPHDTIIIEIDQDIFDLSEGEQLFQTYAKCFPQNTVILMFKGVDIKGIIKGEHYESKKYF